MSLNLDADVVVVGFGMAGAAAALAAAEDGARVLVLDRAVRRRLATPRAQRPVRLRRWASSQCATGVPFRRRPLPRRSYGSTKRPGPS